MLRSFCLFLFAAAAARAAGTLARAGCAVGAADTFSALFLGLNNEESSSEKDQRDYSNDDPVGWIHKLPLSDNGLCDLDLPVSTNAQIYDESNDHGNSHQASGKAGTESTGGDQRAELIDQKSDGIAGG